MYEEHDFSTSFSTSLIVFFAGVLYGSHSLYLYTTCVQIISEYVQLFHVR